jgi:hypothetical protein
VKYVTIYKDYLDYSYDVKNEKKERLYFSHFTHFSLQRSETGASRGVVIQTLNRRLTVRCDNYIDLFDLIYALALAKGNGDYS